MAKIKGREVREVAAKRLEKLQPKSNSAKQIRDRQEYERSEGMRRGGKK